MRLVLGSWLDRSLPASRPSQQPRASSQLVIEFNLLPWENQRYLNGGLVPFRRLLIVLLFLSISGSIARAGSFDPPVLKKTIDLGPARYNPGTHGKVNCYFFADFMVKEVDMGEKGAERLAIVPTGKSKVRTCSHLREPGEKTINPDDWSGYFKGVKGNLVFFDADDGVNSGMGFAVFDSKTGKKMWDDVALGEIDLADSPDKTVTLRYTRVVDGGCIMPKDPTGCWQKITTKLALGNIAAPDCQSGYEKSAQEMAKGRCQAQNSDNDQCLAKEIKLARQQAGEAPSVVSYAVEVVLGEEPTIKPSGGNVGCWPSD